MSVYIIAQLVGFGAVACFIGSFQIKSNVKLYVFQLLGNALFIVHFFLLGALAGCYNLIVSVVRNVVLMNINKKWAAWKGWPCIFIAVYIIVTFFTWQNIFSIFPCIAMAGSTVGMWSNNAQKIRLANLVCASPSWLVYDVWAGSWSGIMNESFILISIIISIVRYGWKNMGSPDSGFSK